MAGSSKNEDWRTMAHDLVSRSLQGKARGQWRSSMLGARYLDSTGVLLTILSGSSSDSVSGPHGYCRSISRQYVRAWRQGRSCQFRTTLMLFHPRHAIASPSFLPARDGMARRHLRVVVDLVL